NPFREGLTVKAAVVNAGTALRSVLVHLAPVATRCLITLWRKLQAWQPVAAPAAAHKADVEARLEV
ncbi:hypothetical protein HaLaN_31268, partial [Haematococcus lacustris]